MGFNSGFKGLIKMTIQNTEARVQIDNLTSKPFLIPSGVRQGDPLLQLYII